jgi:hypothetical protein
VSLNLAASFASPGASTTIGVLYDTTVTFDRTHLITTTGETGEIHMETRTVGATAIYTSSYCSVIRLK